MVGNRLTPLVEPPYICTRGAACRSWPGVLIVAGQVRKPNVFCAAIAATLWSLFSLVRPSLRGREFPYACGSGRSRAAGNVAKRCAFLLPNQSVVGEKAGSQSAKDQKTSIACPPKFTPKRSAKQQPHARRNQDSAARARDVLGRKLLRQNEERKSANPKQVHHSGNEQQRHNRPAAA